MCKEGISTMINQLQARFNAGTPSFCASKGKKSNNKNKNSDILRQQKQPKPERIMLKNDEPQVKPVVTEIEEEDYINPFQDLVPPKKTHKGRDAVLGSLMAMATIAMPTAVLLENDKVPVADSSYRIELVAPPEEFEGTYCNPTALAIGGENDTIVEPAEIMQLLDYSRLETLPKEEQEDIISTAKALINPVNANDDDADKNVIGQVRHLQGVINQAIEKSPNRPSMQYGEAGQEEYERKFITGKELVDCLDYSELSKYQKDTSLLKALLWCNMAEIKRDDAKALEKFDAERQRAQKVIDDISNKYRLNSYVVANGDCNNVITVNEIRGLLDTSVIGHLPRYEQKRVLKEALGSFKTILFNDLKDENDIGEVNKRILDEVQKVQDKLDRRAVPITYRWSMQ